jgi:diketogulonate reductase-like aldo/keto reductase
MTLAYPDEATAGTHLTYEARSASYEEPRAPPRVEGHLRELGRTGVHVSPLVISGAFELSTVSLARAREAGVTSFFWEPDYRALSEHVARAPRKSDLTIIAGSYEADAKTIARDVDRALTRLRIDALGVMLLFWVRSRARLSDEAFDCLTRLKEQGKVRAIGFSTHDRALAADAITARPWDVVMCRHSAAHPGIEAELLPIARARGAGVIGFSALVYGRMLGPDASGARIDAADCYRYSLAQAGIDACISAPRRPRELEENLAVLRDSSLDDATVARLRAHGARVREDNRAFVSLVRRP